MQFDIEGFGSYFDVILSSDITGIKWYQCQNWTYDINHGGNISGSEIVNGENAVFDWVSRAENIAGLIDYRKVFVRNESDQDYPSIKVMISQNSSSIFNRCFTAVALGTVSDTLSNRPADAYFNEDFVGPYEFAVGEIIPIWIRRNLNAGGEGASYAHAVPTSIEVVEV